MKRSILFYIAIIFFISSCDLISRSNAPAFEPVVNEAAEPSETERPVITEQPTDALRVYLPYTRDGAATEEILKLINLRIEELGFRLVFDVYRSADKYDSTAFLTHITGNMDRNAVYIDYLSYMN